jgi:hypothetical protein
VAQVYAFTDQNGETRLFAEIHPDPAGTPFNGGTITNALVVNDPTGAPSLRVIGGGDPVIDGNRIVSLAAGNVAATPVLNVFSDGTFQLDLDPTSPGTFAVTVTGGNLIQATGDAKLGFYLAAPVAQQTGVAVNAAGIHAALVNLGLITA